MKKQIIILGSTGMLGKYVFKYFVSLGYSVVELNRRHVDAANVTEIELEHIINEFEFRGSDVMINCMGTIKPRVDSLGDLNAILVNSVFPRKLANVCERHGIRLIHPTTDCVYSGNKGSYNENDKYDVNDVYGMSKALGEPKNCTVVRTSIIGEEVEQSRSLVEWVKSSSNTTVNGFTNHYWNGVTCLQFAKICQDIIETNNFWKGTKHFHSNTLNKLELVKTISDVYDLNITITPMETEKACDRSMSTIYDSVLGIEIPPLENQIREMKEFSSILYE